MDKKNVSDITHALDTGLKISQDFYSALEVEAQHEASSSFEHWSIHDILVHISAWLDFSHARLKSILDRTPYTDFDDLETFNRTVWNAGCKVSLKEAYNNLVIGFRQYRDTALRFSREDLQRSDFPTGFDWPLWKYIYLDTLVHPAWHFIYHGISRGCYEQAVSALHQAATLMREFSGGDDSVFDLSELVDDPAVFRLACRNFALAFPNDNLVQILVRRHSGPLVRSLYRSFDLSFSMIGQLVDSCPEELWNEKTAGFVYWQQLLHALSGTHYWFRLNDEPFTEPFTERKLYPELDGEPETLLSRKELADYAQRVRFLVDAYFAARDDAWLQEKAIVCDKLNNADVIGMQIRHLMYHAGHCESILREKKYPVLAWED